MGLPPWRRRPRLDANPAGRVPLRVGRARGARARARGRSPGAPHPALADARRGGRKLSRPTRRTGGHDQEAALAARQGDRRFRRPSHRRADLAGDRRVADDACARPSLRGDPGAAAGAPPRGRLGNDRQQRGQGRRRQAGGACGGDRAAVRADDPLRGRHRPAAGGMDGAREARPRSGGVSRLRPSFLHAARAQAAEDGREPPSCPRALDALERVPPNDDSPLLFPGDRGGYLDIHHFRPFQWRPAQLAVGITPRRRIYDLRHTFATFALRAGISTFDLSRYIGASLTIMTGHLARDGREHAIQLLDALNAPESEGGRWWTLPGHRTSRMPSETAAKQGRNRSPLTDRTVDRSLPWRCSTGWPRPSSGRRGRPMLITTYLGTARRKSLPSRATIRPSSDLVQPSHVRRARSLAAHRRRSRVDCPAQASIATWMPTEAPLASRVRIRRDGLELGAQRARVISASR